MIVVLRGNSFAEVRGAPAAFLANLRTHLAVPLEPTNDAAAQARAESRFGKVFFYEGAPWGSLVRDDGRVPAGLTAHVLALAQHYGLHAEYRDVRAPPEEQYPLHAVRAKWREYQDAVQRKIVVYGSGVIDAPPRSGKTLMAARAIDAHAQPTIYIAPSVQIVRQTYEVFCSHFGEDLVARLDGEARPEQRDVSKLIVVSTSASAVRQPPEWWATRRMLILDEFHHSAAETYHRINELACNAYYRLAFTGTHFRSGADELAMQAVASQVLYQIPISYLVQHGYLAAPRIVQLPVRAPSLAGLPWEDAYQQGIVECDARNEAITKLACGLADNGIPTIVLTKRRVHADLLGDRIPESVVVKGGEGALTSSAVKAFCDGRGYVLVGTSVIGEGVDVPRAAALVYASAGDASVGMMQSYFRPLTARDGKSVGLIYDFDDRHHGTLRKHAASRRTFAESYIGTTVVVPGGGA